MGKRRFSSDFSLFTRAEFLCRLGHGRLEGGRALSTIRFTSFPRTQAPPDFTYHVLEVFRANETAICTRTLTKGLTSDAVLTRLRGDLRALGFSVEGSKRRADKIHRPVFFGESGVPRLQYQIDAFHEGWKCGLEIEAGRGAQGNALYRDLVQALVMVELETLILAVANAYRYRAGGREVITRDYDKAVDVADALFGHSRIQMPYRLVVIGY